MHNNPLLALKALGQHVWLDNLSRALLREGTLQEGQPGIMKNPQKITYSSELKREF